MGAIFAQRVHVPDLLLWLQRPQVSLCLFIPQANLAKMPRNRSFRYDEDFFGRQLDGSLNSARVIIPVVLSLISPTSILDVGCGQGAWLRVFQENGIDSVCGIDADYVNTSGLLIPREKFIAADLSQLEQINGHFDLAVCLEVLEHLPPDSGARIVKMLTGAAPVVLFSAAIPRQGGTRHINERWPSYWRCLFEQEGFRLLDPIRPKIRDDRRVMYYYRQNILLFASEEALSKNDILRAAPSPQEGAEVEWIHRVIFERNLGLIPIIRAVRGLVPEKARKSLRSLTRL
jgi:SAM-dependent methyltransferase